jgi:hemoglobin
MDSKSLFERLGSSAGIKAIVDDIVAAHMENAVIGVRFRPYLETPEKVASIKEHVCRFFEMGSGGPQNYKGKGMRGAHKGMNITEAEFVAATDDVLMVLKKHGIDEQSQKDVLAIFWSLKGDVLHV